MSAVSVPGLEGQLDEAKRNVFLLTMAQAIMGSAAPMSFSVGALAGYQLLGADKSLATAPLTGFNIGVALGAICVAAASRFLGRKAGFMVGALMCSIGGGVAAVALFRSDFWLFAVGLLLIGISGGFTQKIRFAAADASPSFYKPKAISWILAGGIISAIVGPQLAIFGKDLLAPWMGTPELVAAGYRVVFQDCRGGGGSGGEPDFFAEAGDGRATADWIAEQPWFDGRLATFGSSYMGFTQWALASTKPPHLKAMVVGIFGAERRAAWYPGGSFALDIALPWTATRIHGIEAMGPEHEERLAAAFDHLPLAEADRVATGRTAPWYQDWLAHAEPGDPYWEPLDFTPALDLGLPVLLIEGWYDYQLPNMVRDHALLQRAGAEARLVIGPWTHAGVDNDVLVPETIRWFDRHVKGLDVDTGAAASVFVMPDVGWRDLPRWPPAHDPVRWWLQPGGGLAPEHAPAGDPTEFVYDPADPTPSFGGASLRPDAAGPVDNRELEARDDVLTFTSGVLDADVELVGPVTAELFLSSSVEHLDVFVRLCDVEPDGRSVNVCDAIRRLTPGDIHRAADGTFDVVVNLAPTAYRFGAGHRIRVQVSGGAHPLYARNTCSGEPLGTATTLVAAHNAVHHDPAHPSAVLLPLPA